MTFAKTSRALASALGAARYGFVIDTGNPIYQKRIELRWDLLNDRGLF